MVEGGFGAFARYAECTARNAETTLGHAVTNLLGPRRPVPESALAQCITTPSPSIGHQTPMLPERPVLPVVTLTGVTDATMEDLLGLARRMGLRPSVVVDPHGRVWVDDPRANALIAEARQAPAADRQALSDVVTHRLALAAELEARLGPVGVALRDAAVASQSAYVHSLSIVFHSHLATEAGGVDAAAARPVFEAVMRDAMRADRCQAAAAALLALAQSILAGRGAPADFVLATQQIQGALAEPAVISPDDLAEAWNPAMAKAAKMRSEIAVLVRSEKRLGIAPPRAPSQVWVATEFGVEESLTAGIAAVLAGDVVGTLRAGGVLFDGEWPIREGVVTVSSLMSGDLGAAVTSAKVLVPQQTGVGRALAIAGRVVTPSG